MKCNFRQILAIGTMALLTLTSCAGESYPGLEYDRMPSEDIINNESGKTGIEGVPIEVFIRPQNYISATTRGVGPFIVPDDNVEPNRADSNRYEKSIFYVLAFRDTPDDQGGLTYHPDYTKHSNDVNDGKVNCLVDCGTADYGMPAKLDFDRTGRLHLKRHGLRLDTTLYYGERYKDIGYNFFAYHVDDLPLEGRMHRDATGVWYDVELDGTRDIMTGHSSIITPELLDSAYTTIAEQLSSDDRNHILNIGNYSDFAAQRGIHPYVDMEHKLSRLRFKAYPADESCDSVYVERIEIECQTKGKLYVAKPMQEILDLGLEMDGSRQWIDLYEKHPTTHRDSVGVASYVLPLDTIKNHITWQEGYDKDNWINNPSQIVGGDMLVASDSLIKMRMVYRQVLRNIDPKTGRNRIQRDTVAYRIPAPKAEISLDPITKQYVYRPGYVYNINIGIYGLRRITLYVEVDGWEDMGDVIDPEDLQEVWE